MESRRHRAVVTADHLFLVPGDPGLVSPGPCGAVLASSREQGVVLADVEVDGREVLVTPLDPDPAPLDAVTDRLARWAALVGFERLWTPTALVPLDPAAAPIGRVTMRCGTCRAALEDWTPGFWSMVRSRRQFPDRCAVCGGTLAQPEAVDELPPSSEAEAAAAGQPAARQLENAR